ncbi:hypothetical protein [Demequina iriomotensis]|uniref:hypothetical protein n=1 Tax=Demequina iriomotensis TaxID=1536641 RepID=UPI000785AEE6|nr:hypothetical protein [Demequina iriomotensis]
MDMWLVGGVLNFLLGLLELGPSPRRLAKERARGVLVAHTRVAAGTVPGLKPFWESKPRWRVELGELWRRDRMIAVVSVDEGSRRPTPVEEQMLGTSMGDAMAGPPLDLPEAALAAPLVVVTVRTHDAAIEIALDPRDERWFRDRLAGVSAAPSAP